MSLIQAIGYFFREAWSSAVANWKASLIAAFTCALSLFIGGFFFLVSSNLTRSSASWQEGLRVGVYLDEAISPRAIEEVEANLRRAPWVASTSRVSSAQARARFSEAFPEISAALEGENDLLLPESIEADIAPSATFADAEWEHWLSELRVLEGVASVQDDRRWIREVRRFSTWVRGAGLAVSLALLVAAAFTIAAVVRLTAIQYLDEIAVLRLVGATEFFVRGPFVVEGFLQGIAGGALAVVGLRATQLALLREGSQSLWMDAVLGEFLSFPVQLAVIGLGGLAGLIGAVVSIRRESLEVMEALDDEDV